MWGRVVLKRLPWEETSCAGLPSRQSLYLPFAPPDPSATLRTSKGGEGKGRNEGGSKMSHTWTTLCSGVVEACPEPCGLAVGEARSASFFAAAPDSSAFCANGTPSAMEWACPAA